MQSLFNICMAIAMLFMLSQGIDIMLQWKCLLEHYLGVMLIMNLLHWFKSLKDNKSSSISRFQNLLTYSSTQMQLNKRVEIQHIKN